MAVLAGVRVFLRRQNLYLFFFQSLVGAQGNAKVDDFYKVLLASLFDEKNILGLEVCLAKSYIPVENL